MSFRDAFSYLKPYRFKLYGIMAMAVAISVISFYLPFVQQRLIDDGLVAMRVQTVVSCACILVGLHLASRLVEYLQKHVEITVANGMGKSLKMDALAHGMRLKPQYFKHQGFYKTMGDALYDIQGIMSITESSFLTFAVIIFKTIGAAIALFILDWRLALFVAALIPIKLCLNIFTSRRAARLNDDCVQQNKRYNSWFGDVIEGILDIKLWNLYGRKRGEYARLLDGMNSRQKRLQLWSQMDGIITGSIEDVVLNGIYVLGVYLIMGQALSLGGLLSFITFAGYLLTPVNLILHMRFMFRQIAPNIKSIKRFYALEEEDYAATLRAPDFATITFDHVSLQIDGKYIVKDISFQLRKGEKVVLTGENGSGKTTLLNLLLQLQEPTSGQIYLDDVPIDRINIMDYRRQFSVVTQDIHLFKGTVAENISMDGSNPDYGAFEAYAFCTDFIREWEQGYNTKVGVAGAKLSGGEKQKIALLRALNRGARVLIMDEPTASYDKESEAAFNEFVRDNQDYDFCIIVSHRREILRHVDRVITLQNGQIMDNHIYGM